MKKLKIKKNVSLKDYSAFKIGGKVKYFLIAKNKEEIIQGIKWAKEKKLPFFVIGNASNILFEDKKKDALIIKIANQEIQFLKNNLVYVGAGTPASFLIKKAKEKSLSGLEWAFLIPATLGGMIYMNASAFSKKISDFIKEVEVYDSKKDEIFYLKKEECQFGYKESIFQKKKNLIILGAILKLKKQKKEEIEKKLKKFLKKRKESQPLNFPSLGCIFKNVKVDKNIKEKIKKQKLDLKFPELKEFLKKKEIPAGYLIDKAGLKGKTIGGAKVSKKHANFIINFKNAKAEDVKKLIKKIKERVKKIFKIELEEEIQFF